MMKKDAANYEARKVYERNNSTSGSESYKLVVNW